MCTLGAHGTVVLTPCPGGAGWRRRCACRPPRRLRRVRASSSAAATAAAAAALRARALRACECACGRPPFTPPPPPLPTRCARVHVRAGVRVCCSDAAAAASACTGTCARLCAAAVPRLCAAAESRALRVCVRCCACACAAVCRGREFERTARLLCATARREALGSRRPAVCSPYAPQLRLRVAPPQRGRACADKPPQLHCSPCLAAATKSCTPIIEL